MSADATIIALYLKSNEKSGYILIVYSCVLSFALILFAGAYLGFHENQVRQLEREISSIKAFYIAQAGLIAEAKGLDSNIIDPNNFGGGSFDAYPISGSSGYESRGTFGEGFKEVARTLQADAISSSDGSDPGVTIFCKNDLRLLDNAKINTEENGSPGDPKRFSLKGYNKYPLNVPSPQIELFSGSQFYGTILAPYWQFVIRGNVHIKGAMLVHNFGFYPGSSALPWSITFDDEILEQPELADFEGAVYVHNLFALNRVGGTIEGRSRYAIRSGDNISTAQCTNYRIFFHCDEVAAIKCVKQTQQRDDYHTIWQGIRNKDLSFSYIRNNNNSAIIAPREHNLSNSRRDLDVLDSNDRRVGTYNFSLNSDGTRIASAYLTIISGRTLVLPPGNYYLNDLILEGNSTLRVGVGTQNVSSSLGNWREIENN